MIDKYQNVRRDKHAEISERESETFLTQKYRKGVLRNLLLFCTVSCVLFRNAGGKNKVLHDWSVINYSLE